MRHFAKIICFSVIFLLSIAEAKPVSDPMSGQIITNDSVRKQIYEGFSLIYNFKFEQAFKVMQYLENKFPSSAWTYILGANYYWWKYQTGENTPAVKNNFYLYLDNAEAKLIDKNTYESKFLISLITAFKARIDIREGKYVSSMTEFMKHLTAISSTMGKEKDFKAFYLTSGLYHYLTAAAYRDYVILRPFLLMIPQGEMNRGIYYLAIRKHDLVLDTESNYFLMKIFFEVEHDMTKAEKFGKALSRQYPDNYVFRDYYYKSLQENSKSKISSKTINSFIDCIESNPELSKLQKDFMLSSIEKNYQTH